MTVWVTDAHTHVQRLVSVVSVVTVLEECTAYYLLAELCSFFVGNRAQCKGYS
jgi:hypothetical protein